MAMLSKKRKYFLFSGSDSNVHLSTWDTTKAGSANDTIILPTEAGGTYNNATINWGDGKRDIAVHGISHVYDYPGIYDIRIEGQFEGFRFNNGGDKAKLIEIKNGGKDFRLGNNGDYFYGCSNLTSVSKLITTGMVDFSQFFRGATSLNCNLYFDTSLANNMSYMFFGATAFNGEVPFDTGNVINFTGMLRNAQAFNRRTDWNTSSATTFNSMFFGAIAYNQDDVKNFDIANVADMTNMLASANSFSDTYYSNALIAWNGGSHQDNVTLDCAASYEAGAAAARTDFINNHGWTINDGGAA